MSFSESNSITKNEIDIKKKCQKRKKEKKKPSILKVLHGNTKSPTGCMYSWRYSILLEVKEGIWPSFKGGCLDFSHLPELKNIYITEIYVKKRIQIIIN